MHDPELAERAREFGVAHIAARYPRFRAARAALYNQHLGMKDLEHVRRALVTLLGDESKLPMINARLILRTGVSLSKIEPHLSQDTRRIGQVLMALREMGYDLELQRR